MPRGRNSVVIVHGGCSMHRSRRGSPSNCASAPGNKVHDFSKAYGAEGEFVVDSLDEADRWLRGNATHFLKIVIPRQPAADVFALKREN